MFGHTQSRFVVTITPSIFSGTSDSLTSFKKYFLLKDFARLEEKNKLKSEKEKNRKRGNTTCEEKRKWSKEKKKGIEKKKI